MIEKWAIGAIVVMEETDEEIAKEIDEIEWRLMTNIRQQYTNSTHTVCHTVHKRLLSRVYLNCLN